MADVSSTPITHRLRFILRVKQTAVWRRERQKPKMAKFSILRDEEEDEADEEFCIRSPKRRRTSHSQPLPTASAPPNYEHHQQHQQQHQQRSGEGDDDNDTRFFEGPTNSGSMSVILSDPDVLDCSICFDPLTSPVFQCDNGHIACSSCCTKLGNKCPSCCGKIGYNRCRAIEKVIESVRVPCCYLRYGCRETVSYCKKDEHEEICIYAPCSCPFPDCIFRGSSRNLSQHVRIEHADFVIRFCYDSIFPVSVRMDEKFIVLQEERDGTLFILSHGNTVTVRCIDPSLSKGRFAYDIVLSKGGSSLKFRYSTHCTTVQVRDSPSVDYFLVPGYFYHTGGHLKLDICIWSMHLSPKDTTQTVNDLQTADNQWRS